MTTIINDAIQVKKVPVDEQGTKEDCFYFSLRADDIHKGSFYSPIPPRIKENRAKTIKWLLSTLHYPIVVDKKLELIFKVQNSLDKLLASYKSTLESIVMGNTNLKNRVHKGINNTVLDNIALPELKSVPKDGLEELLDIRKNIYRKKQRLDKILKIKNRGYSLINDELGRLNLHLNILEQKDKRFYLRGISRKKSGIEEILNWATCYSDTESKNFDSSKYKVPNWFFMRIRKLWTAYRAMPDEEIEERANKVFRERKKSMTHIGLLYKKPNKSEAEVHNVYETGIKEITGTIDNITVKFKIFSYEAKKEEVDKEYAEFLDKLSRYKKRKTVYKKYGVVHEIQDINDIKEDEEKIIKHDIKTHIEEKRMGKGAKDSARKHNPFWWVYHNAAYDIEEKKHLPTERSKDKPWGIDQHEKQPRKKAHIPFMEKEEISDAVIFDTLDIAKTLFPELIEKKLGTFVEYVSSEYIGSKSGNKLPQIILDVNGEKIDISAGGLKYKSHADINPLNLLADSGDRWARKEMLYYHVGDLLLTVWLERKLFYLKKPILNLQQASGLSLNDIIHSISSMEENWDKHFFFGLGKPPNSYLTYREKIHMKSMKESFKKYIKEPLKSKPSIWFKGDSPKDISDYVIAGYIPLTYFFKTIMKRKFPEFKRIIYSEFDLRGNQRVQLVYGRYFENLMRKMFFHRFEIETLNETYSSSLEMLSIKRKDFRKLSEHLKEDKVVESKFRNYEKKLKSMIHNANLFFEKVENKQNKNKKEGKKDENISYLRRELGKYKKSSTDKRKKEKKRLSGHLQLKLFPVRFEEVLLELYHPEVVMLNFLKLYADLDEELQKQYEKFKNACSGYREYLYQNKDIFEEAFKEVFLIEAYSRDIENILYLNFIRGELSEKCKSFNKRYMNFKSFDKIKDSAYDKIIKIFKENKLQLFRQDDFKLYLVPTQKDNKATQAIKNSDCLIHLRNMSWREYNLGRQRKKQSNTKQDKEQLF